jgi:hypothetical protein
VKHADDRVDPFRVVFRGRTTLRFKVSSYRSTAFQNSETDIAKSAPRVTAVTKI